MSALAALPKHIAVVMDGNGRWAKQRHLPRVAGHKAGVEAVRRLVRACAEKKIEALTLFAFSTENWQRPEQEVNALMELFVLSLKREAKQLHENNIQLRFIGNLSGFNPKLRQSIKDAEQLMQNNTGLKLVIAANYGGRWDIVNATKKLCQAVAHGELDVDAIDDAAFSQALCTTDLPDPDLFIRTSGEQRISNFLNWQLAYTELYFTDTLWPDFAEADLEAALQRFQNCERRFGATSEQLKADMDA